MVESFWLREQQCCLEFGLKRGSGGKSKLNVLEYAEGEESFIKTIKQKAKQEPEADQSFEATVNTSNLNYANIVKS